MIHVKQRRQNRAGFTLVHQMIFLAIIPVVLVAATSWINESLKMSSRFKHRRESHVAMNLLANQIQNDVHNCKSLKLDSNLNQIELTGHEDQQITFKIDGNDIEKTFNADGEVVSRENYRLSDEYFAEWNASEMKDDSDRMVLNIFRFPTIFHESAPDSLDVPEPKLEMVISAKVNRWNRSIMFGRETKVATEEGGAE